MSQMNVEQLRFPWIILVVALISSILIFKIGQWGYDYVVWLWNNREKKHRSSKNKKKTKKHVSSDEEGSEESSE